ncbi:MAG TPA: ferritin-like domain-containing protein [Rubricoccaceae bacterium]|jgi:ferritin-like metal-binding protein YciE|nr:ferritin-like domain-containing protein [Rubricoccaceae bacterium]
MALFSSETLNSFEDLYVQQLRDLHSAETQLIEALPMMANAAAHPELKRAFQDHLEVTRQQKGRLDQIFRTLDQDPEGHTCQAMKGLIKEGNDIIKADGDAAVRDAGLIAAAQRVEHYEIAGYGTVRTFAERLGRTEDARLLQQTLDEEANADELLNRIAMDVVNPDAVHA